MILSALVLSSLLGAPPDVIAVDNGAMRIEIDPRHFDVRFVGVPGGENFLDPAFRGERPGGDVERSVSGGLITLVYPFVDDAALANGPADVLDKGPRHAVLMGPVSPESGLRVRKEIRLADTEPRAVFTVTVLAAKPEPVEISVRNEARVPIGSILRIATGNDPLLVIDAPGPLELDMRELRSISVPPANIAYRIVLGALTESLFHVRENSAWSRQMADIHTPGTAYADKRNAVLVLDRPGNEYTATVNGAIGKVSSAAPAVFREIWEIGSERAAIRGAHPDPGETAH